jgi:hypothetical protein
MQIDPSTGRMLSNKEIQEKKDEFRQMKQYPKNLIIEHRTEKGKEEVSLNMTAKKAQNVENMLEDKNL